MFSTALTIIIRHPALKLHVQLYASVTSAQWIWVKRWHPWLLLDAKNLTKCHKTLRLSLKCPGIFSSLDIWDDDSVFHDSLGDFAANNSPCVCVCRQKRHFIWWCAWKKTTEVMGFMRWPEKTLDETCKNSFWLLLMYLHYHSKVYSKIIWLCVVSTQCTA